MQNYVGISLEALQSLLKAYEALPKGMRPASAIASLRAQIQRLESEAEPDEAGAACC
jgi:hypothetical protein